MKKGLKLLFLSVVLSSLLLSMSVFASAADIRSESAFIDFSTVQVYPEPVEPGKDVTIKVNIKNQDELDAHDVKIIPKIVYPFQLKTQEKNWFLGFDLCAQCTRENTYYLLIDNNAESGTYPLIFEIKKGSSKQLQTVNVKVEGVPDVILLTNGSDSISVEPKMPFAVHLLIKNIGTGTARNLKVISGSDNFITSGSNTQFIEELGADKEALITAYFTASDNLEPDVYNLPITLEYRDAVGNDYRYVGNVGVILKNKAELSVKNIKTHPEIIHADDKYDISLRVENTGSGSAKNTAVRIITSAGDSITQYIGQLSKDEDASVLTSLVAKNSDLRRSVINHVTIEVDFDDDLGHHTLNEDLRIEVHPNKRIFWYVVYALVDFVLILLVVAYYFYEHKKEELENRFEEVVEYGLADEFVKKHGGAWQKEHFKGFVRELKSKGFHVDVDRLRRYLEKVRVEHKNKKRH